MSLAVFLTARIAKEIKQTHVSTYLMLLVLVLVNLYGLYSTNLGKLLTLISVAYIILNENIKLGILSFLIVLLLNNKNIEGFEGDKPPKPEDETEPSENKNDNSPDTNDSIASFKALHCKNGKIMKDGKEIDVANLSNEFPQLKFNLENEKCNPCEDNCDFKMTSSVERIAVEEKLRPQTSGNVSSGNISSE
jgi:hypothetical protein